MYIRFSPRCGVYCALETSGALEVSLPDRLAPARPQEQGGAGVFTNSCPLFPSPSLRPRSPRIAREGGGGPGRGVPVGCPPPPLPSLLRLPGLRPQPGRSARWGSESPVWARPLQD